MKHFIASAFWEEYRALGPKTQKTVTRKIEMLRRNSRHPSLQLCRAGKFWTARVSNNYRILGRPKNDDIIWGWVGPHDKYMEMLKSQQADWTIGY